MKQYLTRFFVLLLAGLFACISAACGSEGKQPASEETPPISTTAIEIAGTATAAVPGTFPTVTAPVRPITPTPIPTHPILPTPPATATDIHTPEPEVSLTLVEQLGGQVEALAVAGSYAYIAVGPRLIIVDMTEADEPAIAGQSPVLPIRIISDVQVAGSLAFVADVSQQLFILDISDPSQPVPIGLYQGEARDHYTYEPWSLLIRDNTVFVAAKFQGLIVLDISDPTRPRKIGAYAVSTPNEAWDMFLEGDRLYVAAGFLGLLILDVSDVTQPAMVGHFEMTGETTHVVVEDEIAYIKYNFSPQVQGYEDADKNGLYIVDVSDTAAPEQLSFLYWSGMVSTLTLRDDLLYMMDSLGLHLVAITDPANPTLITTYPLPSAQRLFWAGDRAYVLDRFYQVHTLDMSDPVAPAPIGVYRPPWAGSFHSINIFDGTAYLGTEYELMVADISAPPQITLSDSIEQVPVDERDSSYLEFGTAILHILKGNSTLYAAGGSNGLLVYELSEQLTFIEQVGSTQPDYLQRLALNDNYLFTAEQDGGLVVFDVSDPQRPQWAAALTEIIAQDIVLQAPYVYLAASDGLLMVVDVSNPVQPAIVNERRTGGSPRSVAISGTTLLLANQQTGLHLYDISDPAVPQFISKILDNAHRVFTEGEMAYVLHDLSHLSIVDISRPANPLIIAQYANIREINNLTVADNFLYLATDNGLYILKIMSEK
jgi:hypothetical protein